MKWSMSNRPRILAWLAGAGVLLLLGDRLVFSPLVRYWQASTRENARLEQAIASGRNLLERSGDSISRWQDIQEHALPIDPAQAEQRLVSALDRWGRASGVELGSIKPQWKRGIDDRSSLLECRVDATGPLAAITRFIYELEQSPLTLRVDSIELSARDAAGQTLTLGLLVSGLRLRPLEKKP